MLLVCYNSNVGRWGGWVVSHEMWEMRGVIIVRIIACLFVEVKGLKWRKRAGYTYKCIIT